MDPRYSYDYPATWGRSMARPFYNNYAASMPYASPMSPPPPQPSPYGYRQTPQTRYRGRRAAGRDQPSNYRCLVITVLLIIAVVIIAGVGVIVFALTSKNTNNSSPVEKTDIGFKVTRTDLSYSPAMSDKTTTEFQDTEKTFCDMVTQDWLRSMISSDDCRCSKLVAGSVTATVILSTSDPILTPQQILDLLRQAIPAASSSDPRVNPIRAPDIVFGEPPASSPTMIGFRATRTDLVYTEGLSSKSTSDFQATQKTFCDMITNEWFQGEKIKPERCECLKFTKGSVIANVVIFFPASVGVPEDILNDVRTILTKATAANQNVLALSTTEINLGYPTDPVPTIVSFAVTRKDLTYNDQLADSKSQAFQDTQKTFCDMITKDWLQLFITPENCACVKFSSGSVVCNAQLKTYDSTRTPQEILAQARIFIPPASKGDNRVLPVEANNIVLGDSPDAGPTTIGFLVLRTDMTYSSGLSSSTSQEFRDTEKIFCDMITGEWLKTSTKPDQCKCTKFKSGSVIAFVSLVFSTSTRTSQEILSEMKTVIPKASSFDSRVANVKAANIVIGDPVEPPDVYIGFKVTRTDLNYDAVLQNNMSTEYTQKEKTFCDMVTKNWLKGALAPDKCKCEGFASGSLICTMQLIFPGIAGSQDEVLSGIRNIIPAKAFKDQTTKNISASDIVIGTPPPVPTVIGFTVTRIDLPYSADLLDANSLEYKAMEKKFCDMITIEWLQGQLSSENCKCTKFELGSVIATVRLQSYDPTRSPQEWLVQAQGGLPLLSGQDARTKPISASDIKLLDV